MIDGGRIAAGFGCMCISERSFVLIYEEGKREKQASNVKMEVVDKTDTLHGAC